MRYKGSQYISAVTITADVTDRFSTCCLRVCERVEGHSPAPVQLSPGPHRSCKQGEKHLNIKQQAHKLNPPAHTFQFHGFPSVSPQKLIWFISLNDAGVIFCSTKTGTPALLHFTATYSHTHTHTDAVDVINPSNYSPSLCPLLYIGSIFFTVFILARGLLSCFCAETTNGEKTATGFLLLFPPSSFLSSPASFYWYFFCLHISSSFELSRC